MIKVIVDTESRKRIGSNDKFIELDRDRLKKIDYQGIIWYKNKFITLIEYYEGNDD